MAEILISILEIGNRVILKILSIKIFNSIEPRSGRDEIATFIKTKAGRHSVEYFPASQKVDRSPQIASSYSYYDFSSSCPDS